jgi:hypothetical protein
LATENKDFRVKNGLIVEGTTATVNGEDVLTTASSINNLFDVNTSGAVNGNVLLYNTTSSSWIPGTVSGGGGGSSVIVSPTAPTSPENGDLWFNSSNSKTYIYYNDVDSQQWVEISGAEGPLGPVGPTGPTGLQGATGPVGGFESTLSFNRQGGTEYALVLEDVGKVVELSNPSGISLIVPTNAEVPFPLGTSITLLQSGEGAVVVSGSSGVTINATPSLQLRERWSSATLVKRFDNSWLLMGDLSF